MVDKILTETDFDASKARISDAIIALGGNELPLDSDILCLPIESHNQDSRFYHDNSHREEIAAEIDERLAYRLGGKNLIATANALKCLIGTYHDIVQMSVDDGLPTEIMRIIDPYIIENNGIYFIKEDLHRISSKRIWALLDIFGFEPGQELSVYQTSSNLGGMNEFLSAIAAMDELHRSGLPLKNIVRVLVGICATIPFRGQKFFDKLIERFSNVQIGLTDEEIQLTAIVAVETSNCDVHDFREDNFLHFIQGTWLLLPEYSPGLRCAQFPVNAYRKAICGTLGFLRDQVRPKHIFNSAYGYPTDAEVKDMAEKAGKNIAMGILYVQAKLASIGFLEAVGSLVSPGESLKGLIVDVPAMKYNLRRELSSESQTVFSTLIDREDNLKFDISKSPIAEFMFAILEEDIIIYLSNLVEKLLITEENYPRYRAFLEEVREDLGQEKFDRIIEALADVANHVAPDNGRADKIRGISLILDAVPT